MTEPLPSTITAWIALQTVSRTLLETVEADLAASDLPDLSWYDALFEIEKTGETGIRPFALKDKLLLPQYGTSRLLDRMVKAELIVRIPSPVDGRGHLVAVTAAGRSLRRRMWPVYAAGLKRLVEERLTSDEAEILAQLLGRLRHGLPSPEASPNARS